MDRKKFLTKGLVGLGVIVAIPTLISSTKGGSNDTINLDDCEVSPSETSGPFPIKTPADWVRENIVGNRVGVPLLITLKIENTNEDCKPLSDVFVDIWQCDAKGNYSEYSGQLDGSFTNHHFLRGRQTTDANGYVSFISIYPGWYPRRAPHLHFEIKSKSGKSLLITQTAFPEDVSKKVYNTKGYNGVFDTSNKLDHEFRDSLKRSMATSVTGNITDGFTLTETIKVAG